MATPLAEALIFIRHHQDGEIAEKIRESGLQYNMNYGVSSLLLANYAKARERNQELADQLWKENFREAKLLSFMFAEYENCTDSTVQQYITGCVNNEMAEIAVTYFFAKLANAFDYAKDWILSENRYIKMAGYLTLVRLTMTKKLSDKNDILVLFSAIEKDLTSDDYFVFQSVTKLLQELGFRCPELKPLLIEKIKYICEENKSSKIELQLNELLDNIQNF